MTKGHVQHFQPFSVILVPMLKVCDSFSQDSYKRIFR